MPYPQGHRAPVRTRIVESARRVFSRNGFERVSVDSIMADAGLTRGAFYTYFESKSDLSWSSRDRRTTASSASACATPQPTLPCS